MHLSFVLRYIFAVMFLGGVVTLCGCENGQSGHTTDQAPAAEASSEGAADMAYAANAIIDACEAQTVDFDGKQFHAGQELVRSVSQEDSAKGYQRRFVCVLPQSEFLVQDFYISGEKRTQAYVITSQSDLFDDTFSIMPDSRIEGLYVQWYANGQKAMEVNFEFNAMQGKFEQWYENGQAMRLAHYVNGVRNDEELTWWENGQTRAQGSYFQGKEHGVWQSWWPDGVLRAQGRYVIGKREGLWTWWDCLGVKRAQGNYHGGNRVGVWEYWDAQGQPQGRERLPLITPNARQEANILQNRYGIRLAAARSSQQLALQEPREQELQGQFESGQTWHLNIASDLGVLSELGMQSDAFIRRYIGQTTHGGWVVQDFYADGMRMFSQPFVIMRQDDLSRQFDSMQSVLESSIEGLYIVFYADGRKSLEARMRNGEPVGHWKVWNEAGQMTDEHRYGR